MITTNTVHIFYFTCREYEPHHEKTCRHSFWPTHTLLQVLSQILTFFPTRHNLCHLLWHIFFSSLYCKQYGPRSDCSQKGAVWSGFIGFASMLKSSLKCTWTYAADQHKKQTFSCKVWVWYKVTGNANVWSSLYLLLKYDCTAKISYVAHAIFMHVFFIKFWFLFVNKSKTKTVFLSQI